MDENVSLLRSKLDIRGTKKDRIYCRICLTGWVAKHQATLDVVWKKIQVM